MVVQQVAGSYYPLGALGGSVMLIGLAFVRFCVSKLKAKWGGK
jgi:hypothetical protein